MNLKKLLFLIPITVLLYLTWCVINQFRAERCYPTRLSSLWDNKISILPARESLNRLKKAIALDKTNAEYHYHLAQTYNQMMQEGLKKGKWKLENGKWILKVSPETLDYGFEALDSYQKAIDLNPTHAYAHLGLGWTLSQLSQLSVDSDHSPESPINPKNLMNIIDSINSFTHPLNHLATACALARPQ